MVADDEDRAVPQLGPVAVVLGVHLRDPRVQLVGELGALGVAAFWLTMPILMALRVQRTGIDVEALKARDGAALRAVLGDHVKQAGSLVEPERLRFDVSHPKTIEPADLAWVERRSSRSVRQKADPPLRRNAPSGVVTTR